MRNSLITFLRRHPEYALVSLGMFLSNVGSGLTQVALYTKMADAAAPSYMFAAAFALAVVPGLFVGRLAARLAATRDWAQIMAGAQLLGAIGMLPAVVGAWNDQIGLFMTAELAAALTAGLSYPVQQSLIKRLFDDRELGLVLKLDTAVFAMTILFGIGLGSLLFRRIGIQTYILADLASYGAASFAIYAAWRLRKSAFKPEPSLPVSATAVRMAPVQRRAFLLLPSLALVGAPAMALLPFAAQRFGASFEIGGFSLAPGVAFIFAKAIGQMLAPALVPGKALGWLARSRLVVWVCLAVFAGCYCGAMMSQSAVTGLLLVCLAHVASNVVFVAGIYAMQAAFSTQTIAAASAAQYRLQIAVMAVGSLASGTLAAAVPSPVIVLSGFAASAMLLLVANRQAGGQSEPA